MRTSFFLKEFSGILTAFTSLTLRSNYNLGGFFRHSHSENKLFLKEFSGVLTAFTNLTL